MIDPNVDLAEYEAADKRKKFLQHQLSKQKSIDIAYLFIHLVLNDNYIKEPYLQTYRDGVLNFLNITNKDLFKNIDIEDAAKRLSCDYSFFDEVESICGFCCMSIKYDAPILQKFVYKNEYKNILKYKNK
jgi:hypothetical protein